jgi:hypothetical protein
VGEGLEIIGETSEPVSLPREMAESRALMAMVWFNAEKVEPGGPVHPPPYMSSPDVERSMTALNCSRIPVKPRLA